MRATKESMIEEAISIIDSPSMNLSSSVGEKIKENNFEMALSTILGRHAWSAFFRREKLVNCSPAGDEHYKFKNKFALPTDFLKLFAVAVSVYDFDSVYIENIWESGEDYYNGGEGTPPSDYEKMGDFIYTNANEIFVAYQHGDLEKAGILEPAFKTAMVALLASLFAYSLRTSAGLSQLWDRKAEQAIQFAVNADKLAIRKTEENPVGFGRG